jgi:NTP pyrophosphatase (non-canonical NTP hydrolase)
MSTNTWGVVVLEGETGTTPMRYDMFVKRLFKADSREAMLIHAALGIAGEAGEIVDAIKKHCIYGKPLDLANVIEELGDLRFYMEGLCNVLDLSDQEVIQGNMNKLAQRYKSLTYTDGAAIERADKVVQAGSAS